MAKSATFKSLDALDVRCGRSLSSWTLEALCQAIPSAISEDPTIIQRFIQKINELNITGCSQCESFPNFYQVYFEDRTGLQVPTVQYLCTLAQSVPAANQMLSSLPFEYAHKLVWASASYLLAYLCDFSN